MDSKTLVVVGDLKRGRTVRSLSYLMKNYKGVKLVFVSPPELRMGTDILAFLRRHGIPFRETDDLRSTLPEADAIYMTRIQDEYDVAEDLGRIKPTCVLLHPLPRRHEIDPTVDDDERAVYWRQERNGMWIRAALIAYIFGVDQAALKVKA